MPSRQCIQQQPTRLTDFGRRQRRTRKVDREAWHSVGPMNQLQCSAIDTGKTPAAGPTYTTRRGGAQPCSRNQREHDGRFLGGRRLTRRIPQSSIPAWGRAACTGFTPLTTSNPCDASSPALDCRERRTCASRPQLWALARNQRLALRESADDDLLHGSARKASSFSRCQE
jgi:hypothetical protein